MRCAPGAEGDRPFEEGRWARKSSGVGPPSDSRKNIYGQAHRLPDTDRPVARYATKSIERGARTIMLFGKRERTIRRIIVVEDEPLVAFDSEHFLNEAGYEVVATVDTLADAVRVIEVEQLDLVLSDITLRGEGDGTDVARAAAAKGVAVLFVTGDCPPEAQSLGLGWLAKPYNDKTLKAALDSLDSLRSGRKVRKLPAGLSLFRTDDGAEQKG
jgi:CheY-like chemotaxis protein